MGAHPGMRGHLVGDSQGVGFFHTYQYTLLGLPLHQSPRSLTSYIQEGGEVPKASDKAGDCREGRRDFR